MAPDQNTPDWLPNQPEPFTGQDSETEINVKNKYADPEQEVALRAGLGIAKMLSFIVALISVWVYVSLFFAAPPAARLLQLIVWGFLLWNRKWPVFIAMGLMPVAAGISGMASILWFVEMTLWLVVGIWALGRYRHGVGPLVYTPINGLIVLGLLIFGFRLMPLMGELWSLYINASPGEAGFLKAGNMYQVFMAGPTGALNPIRVIFQTLLLVFLFFYLLSQFHDEKQQNRLLVVLFPFWMLMVYLIERDTRPGSILTLSYSSAGHWMMFFAPLALALAFAKTKTWHYPVFLGCFLIIGGLCSNSTIVAFLMIYLCAFCITLFCFIKKVRKQKKEINEGILFAAIVAFGFMALFFVIFSSFMIPKIRYFNYGKVVSEESLMKVVSEESLMDDDAVQLKNMAGEIFSEHKMLGVGPGRFWSESRKMYPESPTVGLAERDLPPLHLWRKLAAEYGVLGMLILLLLSVVLILRFFMAFWKSGDSPGRDDAFALSGLCVMIGMPFVLWADVNQVSMAVPLVMCLLCAFSLQRVGLVGTDRMTLLDAEKLRVANAKRQAYMQTFHLRFDSHVDDTFGTRAIWSLGTTCLFLPFLLLSVMMVMLDINSDLDANAMDFFRLHLIVGAGVWLVFSGALRDRSALPGINYESQVFMLLLRVMLLGLGIIVLDLLKRLIFGKSIYISMFDLGNNFGAGRVMVFIIGLQLTIALAILLSEFLYRETKDERKRQGVSKFLPWVLLILLPICYQPEWLPGWLHFILALNPVYPAVRFMQAVFVSESYPGLGVWFGLIFWCLFFSGWKTLSSSAALQILTVTRAIHKMMKEQGRDE